MNQTKSIPRILIAGTHSGCGKTTVTCGILRALQNRKMDVRAFKCGPDYIDPMFHSEVIGAKSRNIDMFLCSEEISKMLFAKNSSEEEQGISLVEGVMGYYDGLGGNTVTNSTYHISKEFQIPTILVVDCKGASISTVAMIQGYLKYRENPIVGVILNQVSKMMLPFYREMIEKETGIQVLGCLPKSPEATIGSRHLGLITAEEIKDLNQKLDTLGNLVEENIDIDKMLVISRTVPIFEYVDTEKEEKVIIEKDTTEKDTTEKDITEKDITEKDITEKDITENEMAENGTTENYKIEGYVTEESIVKIAVAKDKAFCFYYQDGLNTLEELGAELVYFSPLSDDALPEGINGIIFGGGYPELYLKELSTNSSMLESIRAHHEKKTPIYAECGGYMYLGQSIDGYEMTGIIDMKSEMTTRLQNFGYATLTPLKEGTLVEGQAHAHEFHYSKSDITSSVYQATKSTGKNWKAGYCTEHVFAQYPHIHFSGEIGVAKSFVEKCVKHKLTSIR